MKALSLRQPWAAAVLRLGKIIENRRWSTSFRGEFLIHASKGMTRDEFLDAYDWCVDVVGFPRVFEVDAALDYRVPGGGVPGAKLPRGAIVGRATLVGVVAPRPERMLEGLESHYPEALRDHAWRWHMREQFGFILADVVEFEKPIPWSGALGFFRTPFDRDGRREST